MSETHRIQVKGFPADLWRDLKVAAARKRITVKQAITAAVTEWLARQEKPS